VQNRYGRHRRKSKLFLRAFEGKDFCLYNLFNKAADKKIPILVVKGTIFTD